MGSRGQKSGMKSNYGNPTPKNTVLWEWATDPKRNNYNIKETARGWAKLIETPISVSEVKKVMKISDSLTAVQRDRINNIAGRSNHLVGVEKDGTSIIIRFNHGDRLKGENQGDLPMRIERINADGTGYREENGKRIAVRYRTDGRAQIV